MFIYEEKATSSIGGSFYFGGNGANKVNVRYALNTNASTTSRVEFRLGAVDGELIATVNLPQTAGNWSNYVVASADLARQVTGEHDLYLVFLGDSGKWIGNFDYFAFEEAPGGILVRRKKEN